jgi:hypothetical protein
MDLKRGNSIAVTNPRVMRGIGNQPLVYMCSLEVKFSGKMYQVLTDVLWLFSERKD